MLIFSLWQGKQQGRRLHFLLGSLRGLEDESAASSFLKSRGIGLIQIKATNEGMCHADGLSIAFILDGVDSIVFRSHSSNSDVHKVYRISTVKCASKSALHS